MDVWYADNGKSLQHLTFVLLISLEAETPGGSGAKLGT